MHVRQIARDPRLHELDAVGLHDVDALLCSQKPDIKYVSLLMAQSYSDTEFKRR